MYFLAMALRSLIFPALRRISSLYNCAGVVVWFVRVYIFIFIHGSVLNKPLRIQTSPGWWRRTLSPVVPSISSPQPKFNQWTSWRHNGFPLMSFLSSLYFCSRWVFQSRKFFWSISTTSNGFLKLASLMTLNQSSSKNTSALFFL